MNRKTFFFNFFIWTTLKYVDYYIPYTFQISYNNKTSLLFFFHLDTDQLLTIKQCKNQNQNYFKDPCTSIILNDEITQPNRLYIAVFGIKQQ